MNEDSKIFIEQIGIRCFFKPNEEYKPTLKKRGIKKDDLIMFEFKETFDEPLEETQRPNYVIHDLLYDILKEKMGSKTNLSRMRETIENSLKNVAPEGFVVTLPDAHEIEQYIRLIPLDVVDTSQPGTWVSKKDLETGERLYAISGSMHPSGMDFIGVKEPDLDFTYKTGYGHFRYLCWVIYN